jgi:hypothetical protein
MDSTVKLCPTMGAANRLSLPMWFVDYVFLTLYAYALSIEQTLNARDFQLL